MRVFLTQHQQLERDLQQVMDEKEELVTERDVYRLKYDRLNKELHYILKGDERRVLDVDALIMENRSLRLLQLSFLKLVSGISLWCSEPIIGRGVLTKVYSISQLIVMQAARPEFSFFLHSIFSAMSFSLLMQVWHFAVFCLVFSMPVCDWLPRVGLGL